LKTREQIRIYSFDVFDTIVTRPFIRPTDIFWLVGRTLSKTINSRINPICYRKDRIKAEHRARVANKPFDDCGWDAIFNHFPELSRWGVAPEQAMAAELSTERMYSRPIAENVAKVHQLIDSDEKVIFLSDMYLPTNFVWELIRSQGVDCPRDRFYISGDLGLAKHTGRLYSHVIQQYGIAPSQLLHYGDNQHADVEVPRRLGIKTEHYREVQPNRHERLPRPRSRAPVVLSSMHGTARAARLRTIHPEKWAQVVPIATSVVAPILTAFAAWVLRDARERGIERLYFVSRDGQILQRIASVLRQDGDPDVPLSLRFQAGMVSPYRYRISMRIH
jgi:predicted HAD superfamily hydrolase